MYIYLYVYSQEGKTHLLHHLHPQPRHVVVHAVGVRGRHLVLAGGHKQTPDGTSALSLPSGLPAAFSRASNVTASFFLSSPTPTPPSLPLSLSLSLAQHAIGPAQYSRRHASTLLSFSAVVSQVSQSVSQVAARSRREK